MPSGPDLTASLFSGHPPLGGMSKLAARSAPFDCVLCSTVVCLDAVLRLAGELIIASASLYGGAAEPYRNPGTSADLSCCCRGMPEDVCSAVCSDLAPGWPRRPSGQEPGRALRCRDGDVRCSGGRGRSVGDRTRHPVIGLSLTGRRGYDYKASHSPSPWIEICDSPVAVPAQRGRLHRRTIYPERWALGRLAGSVRRALCSSVHR